MKKLLACAAVIAGILFLSCSGQKYAVTGKTPTTSTPVKDSIEYYDMPIEARQKSYKAELEGQWKVISMRRQQKAVLEPLQNVFIRFGTDTAFTGKAPCNRMGGIYTLKGGSVRFSGIYSTKLACSEMEPETAFLQLLGERVSTFVVNGNKLQLMDGSANVVFECERE